MDDTLQMDEDMVNDEDDRPVAAAEENADQTVAMAEAAEEETEAESPTTPFLFRLTLSARRQFGPRARQESPYSTPLARSATVASFSCLRAFDDQDSSFTSCSPSPSLMRPPKSKRQRGFGLDRSNTSAALLTDVAEENDKIGPSPKRKPKPVVPRCLSDTSSLSRSLSESIMRACDVRASTSNITADTARPLSLPTVEQGVGKHSDLDTIDCHTLAALVRGEYSSSVGTFRIIDARYVYEFEGGHVLGAENFGSWDKDAFLSTFLPEDLLPLTAGSHEDEDSRGKDKADILVFHCEFSSARGPALLRDLRKRDRCLNAEAYPALHYPECYLLHNGYKEFFENYPQLCKPQAYVPMKDPGFAGAEKLFHKKSKTWAGGGGGGTGTGRLQKGTRLGRADRFFL